MQKRWLVRTPPPEEEIEKLAAELVVPDILAKMLIQRGITEFEEAKRFFRPTLDELHDPFLFLNMDKAVARLTDAIAADEKILIYGDYDVDGTTSVALVSTILKEYSEKTEIYIPDRYTEGYGVSFQAIEYAKEQDFNLIITLDCGIKAVNKIAKAKEYGIDVIVCDHHNPGEVLPDAIILDTKQDGCNYPYKELCGCGVGFKLMHAFLDSQGYDTDLLFKQLDLVAIAIAADIVPMTGENRVLAYHGLELLNKNERLGVAHVMNLAKRKMPLTITDVVFLIAPRINAAGRMGDAKDAVQLLTSQDVDFTLNLAKEIQISNDARKDLDKLITAEALELLAEEEGYEDKCTTVVYSDDWHKGVIGIVASRLIETHYRPTVVLTKSEGKYAGSVRSVKEFDVYEALSKCEKSIEQFGGHKYAAGLTVLEKDIELFKEEFENAVKELITDELLIPQQLVELELDFDEIFTEEDNRNGIPKIKRILTQFEPHGPGNMKPVFVSKNVHCKSSNLLKGEHLKLRLIQSHTDIEIDAIGFFMSDKWSIATSGEPFDVAYTFDINEWREKKTLQLHIKDMRPSFVRQE